jgi:hypothetical protein
VVSEFKPCELAYGRAAQRGMSAKWPATLSQKAGETSANLRVGPQYLLFKSPRFDIRGLDVSLCPDLAFVQVLIMTHPRVLRLNILTRWVDQAT